MTQWMNPLHHSSTPAFFDFDNGTPLSKEELKGTSFVLFFACVVIDSSVELIYEEVTRPLAVA